MSVMVADVANSTLTLNGRTIEDTPEGDVFTVAFGNDITKQTQGSNGGKVIKRQINKDDMLLTIRVLKYSGDDAFLQNAVNNDIPVIFEGSVKTNFTRDGVDGTETYPVTSGSLTTRDDATINNTDGDDIMAYNILCISKRTV